jgi:coenzyme F420 hydrogenase subunit beta
METETTGWSRPRTDELRGGADDTTANARRLAEVCPGLSVRAPRSAKLTHPVFGPYLACFEGVAADPVVREAGSSAGVISALAAWLLETGRSSAYRAARASANGSGSVPVTIRRRDDVLASAGSRYAPVSMLDHLEVGADAVVVAKPCEIAAFSTLRDAENRPLLISFFCAGVPNQRATDRLVAELGVAVDATTEVRYRGHGWPGRFTASDGSGASGSLSYEDSWGRHLGRDLQWRCKICVDGTGADADVSVGDLWETDDGGYPRFAEGRGRSVVIARTARGLAALRAAEAAGIVVLEALDIRELEGTQPLHVRRRTTLLGRLAGARLAGQRVPRYRGFGLTALALRRPAANARAGIWTWLRVARRGRDAA